MRRIAMLIVLLLAAAAFVAVPARAEDPIEMKVNLYVNGQEVPCGSTIALNTFLEVKANWNGDTQDTYYVTAEWRTVRFIYWRAVWIQRFPNTFMFYGEFRPEGPPGDYTLRLKAHEYGDDELFISECSYTIV